MSFYINRISISGSVSRSDNDVVLNSTSRDQKVTTEGTATLSATTLLKGIRARNHITLNNNCDIQRVTESTMGGITANNSKLQDITARNKVTMNRCIAEDVEVSMAGLDGEYSTFQNIKTRNHVELANCSVTGDVNVEMGGLSWDNDVSYTEKFQCQSITTRDEVRLKNIHAHSVESEMKAVHVVNCTLKTVTARNNSQLINTSADTVKISMGSLEIIAQGQQIEPYQNLQARGQIALRGIQALTVKSDTDTVVAENCTLGSAEGNQWMEVKNSTFNQNIKLVIDPSKPCMLFLTGSTVKGDIIVEASENTYASGVILRNCTVSNTTVKSCSSSDMVIRTGETYTSIADIPEHLLWLAKNLNEGQTITIGNLKCVVRNGSVELWEPPSFNFEELKQNINRFVGQGATISRLELDGGVYKVTRGNIEVIQAPPGLIMETIPTTTTHPLPHVTLEIHGGRVEGKVIFKNCQGTVQALDDAILQSE